MCEWKPSESEALACRKSSTASKPPGLEAFTDSTAGLHIPISLDYIFRTEVQRLYLEIKVFVYLYRNGTILVTSGLTQYPPS